jgi:putative redox protein
VTLVLRVAHVTLDSPEGYAAAIRAGRHRVGADEPVARGGTDTAPSPYELLLAALASCTSITLRMYAERKQWTLGAIQVEASYHLEGTEGRITRVVSFGEALGEEQRARLAEIAEKTPVTRALKAGVPIATTLRSADQTGET